MVENHSSINEENDEGKNCNKDINLISLDEDPIVTRLEGKNVFYIRFSLPFSPRKINGNKFHFVTHSKEIISTLKYSTTDIDT